MFVPVPLCTIPGVILWFTPVNVFICFLFCFTLYLVNVSFIRVYYKHVFYECMYVYMHACT